LFYFRFFFPSAVSSALVNPFGHVVFGNGICIFGVFRQDTEIPAYHLVGYLGINLSRFYVGMPHHLTDSFDGYAVCQTGFGGKRMAGHVVGQMATQFALFRNDFKAAAEAACARNKKYLMIIRYFA